MKELKNTDWYQYLKDEFEKDYFINLSKFIDHEYESEEIFPPRNLIYNALLKTSLEKTKVVILGQDPYHGPSQAHGLSFSVADGVKIPPSLKNIFKELNEDLGIEKSNNGNLENWAKQGVLLLNNTLTVRAGLAGSHQKNGWEIFTQKIIEIVNAEKENVVFILWGAPAQKKAHFVNRTRHLVLESAHPSPLSSYRGFFGSKPFSQSNNYLMSKKLCPIKW